MSDDRKKSVNSGSENQQNQDLQMLDSLLESINNDDTMEKKINEFARTRERRKRIEKARETSARFQSQYSSQSRQPQGNEEKGQPEQNPVREKNTAAAKPAAEASREPSFSSEKPGNPDELGSTMVAQGGLRASTEPASPDHAGGGTIVYPKKLADAASEAPAAEDTEDHTVYVDENELKSLLEDEEPLLKREYVRNSPAPAARSRQADYASEPVLRREPARQPARSYREPEPKRMSWKWPILIFVLVLGTAAVFGGIQLFNNYMEEQRREADTETQKNFDEIMKWAEDYDALSDDEKAQIMDLEKQFNKLSDDQKRQINEVLIKKTGKSFDKLLAEAKSGGKQDTDTNTTEIAEKKASLRQQINQLQGQLEAKRAELSNAQGSIGQSQQDYNDAKAAYDQAKSEYDGALAVYNDLVSRRDGLAAEAGTIQDDITRLNQEISDMQNSEDEDKETKLEDLKNQLAAKQSDLTANQSQQAGLNNQISTAGQTLSDKQTAMDSAMNNMNNALSAYQGMQGSDGSIQADVTSLENQIADLQNQLNALN